METLISVGSSLTAVTESLARTTHTHTDTRAEDTRQRTRRATGSATPQPAVREVTARRARERRRILIFIAYWLNDVYFYLVRRIRPGSAVAPSHAPPSPDRPSHPYGLLSPSSLRLAPIIIWRVASTNPSASRVEFLRLPPSPARHKRTLHHTAPQTCVVLGSTQPRPNDGLLPRHRRVSRGQG
jgi:hypothetical protein